MYDIDQPSRDEIGRETGGHVAPEHSNLTAIFAKTVDPLPP
jgi:hypothetical protein